MARRDNREYRTYLRAEQRRQRGCIARRMQRHLHYGLLGLGVLPSSSEHPEQLDDLPDPDS